MKSLFWRWHYLDQQIFQCVDANQRQTELFHQMHSVTASDHLGEGFICKDVSQITSILIPVPRKESGRPSWWLRCDHNWPVGIFNTNPAYYHYNHPTWASTHPSSPIHYRIIHFHPSTHPHPFTLTSPHVHQHHAIIIESCMTSIRPLLAGEVVKLPSIHPSIRYRLVRTLNAHPSITVQ